MRRGRQTETERNSPGRQGRRGRGSAGDGAGAQLAKKRCALARGTQRERDSQRTAGRGSGAPPGLHLGVAVSACGGGGGSGGGGAERAGVAAAADAAPRRRARGDADRAGRAHVTRSPR